VENLEDRTVPTVITLSPAADNTLYQDTTGHLSNGAGQHFYVGDTVQATNFIRRGAIKFDTSSIPTGATINSVTLSLNMSLTIDHAAEPIVLHRAMKNWGEGTSNAAVGGAHAGEGAGAQATAGDVTWLYTFFNSQTWTSPGGDFVAAASATTPVAGVGNYQWSGAGLVADVQQWVNNPATSFGWIITGNETAKPTAKQFDTKENAVPANRPVLTIDFTPPQSPPPPQSQAADLTVVKSHTGNFRTGDTADVYTVTVSNVGRGATAGTVMVVDTLPTGLTPTVADNGKINGWTVSFSGQTITATRTDVLAAGAAFPPLTLTVAVSNTAPSRVTNMAVVSGGGDTTPGNNTATDLTSITRTVGDARHRRGA
jgi:uncharacterized repeat protein (TIGR01451 family)